MSNATWFNKSEFLGYLSTCFDKDLVLLTRRPSPKSENVLSYSRPTVIGLPSRDSFETPSPNNMSPSFLNVCLIHRLKCVNQNFKMQIGNKAEDVMFAIEREGCL